MVGLDISCNNLKLVELKKRAGKLSIIKAASQSIDEELINPDFTEANIKYPEKLAEQIAAVYQRAGINKSTLCLSLPSVCVRLFFMHFEKTSSNREEMIELIRWQINKQLPRADFQALITYQEAANPSPNNHQLLVAIANQPVIKEYENLLMRAKKKPVRIEVNFLAAYNYFEEPLTDREDFLFIYSSYSVTNLLFFQAGNPIFYHRIDLGGRDYTKTIAHKKNFSIEQANTYKSKALFFPDLNSSDPRIMENFALIKETNENLFKKIYDSIHYFLNAKPERQLTRIFLCGEGLAFTNIALFGENFLGLDCERLGAESLVTHSSYDLNQLYPAIGAAMGISRP